MLELFMSPARRYVFMSGSPSRDLVAVEREDKLKLRSDCREIPVSRLVDDGLVSF